MSIETLAENHFRTSEKMSLHSLEMILELIEYQARQKDSELQKDLLEKLVYNYSAAERKLSELNQLKNKFIGIAAHDLRNPLTSIRGFAEILLEDTDNLTDDQLEMIGIIHDASENMLSLVNDLLDVSVIESGRLDLQIKKHSLKKLIEDRCKMISITSEKKKIKLNLVLDNTGECEFDRNRMAQVIDNIIGNAVKFSPMGSMITICLEKNLYRHEIRISDQGPGLSEEDKLKLFSDFQRLSAQPTGGEKSTGLGLAITKKVVDAHNGDIMVESRLGEGTTFIVVIPGGE